ncbi:MAG: inner membrane protein YpjD [Gammaproteobacteria bacterium]
MTTVIFSAIAIFLYLLAAGWLGYRVFKLHLNSRGLKTQLVAVGSAALLLHALVLYQSIMTATGFNLGFYNALSLMSWVVALFVVFVALIKPVENLAVVFLPAAALALTLELFFPSEHILPDSYTLGLRLHILLSITAYSLLAIAALQSITLAIQEHQLRHKHPVRAMRILPPMQTMEELLIQILAIGFFLLSLSLVTGLMFVHDFFAQHLIHKTVLSILAWLIFGMMLWGKWAKGWRGRKLIYWTLGGFLTLMLAYFGSKMVLELILHRV